MSTLDQVQLPPITQQVIWDLMWYRFLQTNPHVWSDTGPGVCFAFYRVMTYRPQRP